MERGTKLRNTQTKPAVGLIKSLAAAYLLTAGGILLLALLMYRLELENTVLATAVLIVYMLSGLLAGLIAGKCVQVRRFMWGLLSGTFYFLVLVCMTAVVKQEFTDFGSHFFTTWMICAGSGMLGGMIS
ncbi:MAG: TIGR04086 family membrane protein [Lachnospiraceae bacterium]|nr:TIGR04086 family membrane protein [Lachnospiraceae bacterium]